MVVEGIDISHWQATTPPLGTSLGFVFVRATYGTARDDRYAMHARNVRDAGKVLGAYAFGRDMDGAAQARAFLAAVGDVQLVALDYERDGDHGHMTAAQARAFIATIRASGRQCGLYASDSGYPDLGQDWDWVARWGDRPARPWTFWQYAVTGTPRIDRDRFAGTLAQLRALARLTPTFRVVVHPLREGGTRRFNVYGVRDGRVVARSVRSTGGFSADCTPPVLVPWPGHVARRLVRVTSGFLEGEWLSAGWAE